MGDTNEVCVLCRGARLAPEVLGLRYQLTTCKSCGLTQARSGVDAAALYSEAYVDSGSYGGYARDQIARIKAGHVPVGWPHRQFFAVTPHPGRLLDVGCGSGAFLVAAKRRGWRGTGFELSNHAASLAREELALDVREGDLETAFRAEPRFDAVTAWEVLEHVPDPVAFVDRIMRLLKPGGVLALSTPDWESGWPRRMWRDLPQAWPPIHLTFWSAACLERLLREAGLARVCVRKKPWAAFYEMGGRRGRLALVGALGRSVVLGRGGGQLFAYGVVQSEPAAGRQGR